MLITQGVSRAHAASGINDASWHPHLDDLGQTRRAAIYCHPMVSKMKFVIGNAAAAFDGQDALTRGLSEPGGYAEGGSDLGYYNTGGWGNPAEQTEIGLLDAWARAPIASGGNGGKPDPLVAVGVSAGMMGIANYYGKAPGHAANLAAIVWILPPWDLRSIYVNDRAGDARAGVQQAWGITWAGVDNLPAGASPRDNTALLAGIPMRIYYASNDPLNGAADIAAMVAAYGPATTTAIDVGALGHTEAAIFAVSDPAGPHFGPLVRWLHDVAPPI